MSTRMLGLKRKYKLFVLYNWSYAHA